jgi:hypothetical protein
MIAPSTQLWLLIGASIAFKLVVISDTPSEEIPSIPSRVCTW